MIFGNTSAMRLIFFFSKQPKFNVHFRNAIKNQKKFWVLEISSFEVVAVNSSGSKQNACNRQSKC